MYTRLLFRIVGGIVILKIISYTCTQLLTHSLLLSRDFLCNFHDRKSRFHCFNLISSRTFHGIVVEEGLCTLEEICGFLRCNFC